MTSESSSGLLAGLSDLIENRQPADMESLLAELVDVLRRHLGPARDVAPSELTPDEVATRLRKSRAWVYRHMKSGDLPFVQVSAARRVIRARDLEAFLVSRRCA